MNTDKKYWLRGLITALLLSLLYTLWAAYTLYSNTVANSIQVDFSILIRYITSSLYLIPHVILPMIIGSFIGWIYGKIKNRKQVSATIN